MLFLMLSILALSTHTTYCYQEPVPLPNKGNSCYMNTALQILYAIPELREFLIENSETHYKKATFNYDLAHLFSTFQSKNTNAISKALETFYTQHINCSYTQQDAVWKLQELFISSLLNEDNKTHTQHSIEDLLLSCNSQKLCDFIWPFHSFYNVPWHVGLVIAQQEFTQNSCLFTTLAQYWAMISDSIISTDGIPQEFDMAPLTTTPHTPCIMELIGAIIHHGGYSGGHYDCYVKLDTTWFYCSDTTIEKKLPYFFKPYKEWHLGAIRLLLWHKKQSIVQDALNTAHNLAALTTLF